VPNRLRAFGGRTAHHLVRTLDVPLLVVAAATRPVEHVLAALDLSDIASRVLAAAVRVARLLGARLRLLHAVEPIKFPKVVPVTLDREVFYRRAETAFERLTARVADVAETDRVTRRGEATVVVEAEAAAWSADLIVVGSHGKGRADRLLVGSTTERLLNALPASLLIVPSARARRGRRAAVRTRRARAERFA
jgi:nucleotide-binding universal stress UspA family protein